MSDSKNFNLITDSEFNDSQIYDLLPPPEVIKSEAIIAKKELRSYSDSSIKNYVNNGVYTFTIQPLQDSLISLDSLKLNIVAKCKADTDATQTGDEMIFGDFTLMNHISQITLKIGGADVQTIANPCIIKNMSKLFKYGSESVKNKELEIRGLYNRKNGDNYLTSTNVIKNLNNIGYFKGNPSASPKEPAEFTISEIIPLSDIFQVDFYEYPLIYNRKIEVVITWNSEKVVDINTMSAIKFKIDSFDQYYLMYEANILNQDSRNQMIKAYQKPVKALIPNTNYILSSLGSYSAGNQMQQTISIPIGFSSDSITLFFPNSTSASETYCIATSSGNENCTNHTCNSFRFMNLRKVVVSCGTNVLKTFDFRESSVKYDHASTLLQAVCKNDTAKPDVGNYAIAYETYLKDVDCRKISYDEFISDYFCLYIDTKPFSQISSNNTLQIDITFGDVVDSIKDGDKNKCYTNQRILGNVAVLKQIGVVTKNTKVLSFDQGGTCTVYNVANNILNDYLEV